MVPTSRVGVVVYRDQGDEYVTKWSDLSFKTDKLHELHLQHHRRGRRRLGGGGARGRRRRHHELSWRKKSKKIIILIGGSPPHPEDVDSRSSTLVAQVPPATAASLSTIDVTDHLHLTFNRELWHSLHGNKPFEPPPKPEFYKQVTRGLRRPRQGRRRRAGRAGRRQGADPRRAGAHLRLALEDRDGRSTSRSCRSADAPRGGAWSTAGCLSGLLLGRGAPGARRCRPREIRAQARGRSAARAAMPRSEQQRVAQLGPLVLGVHRSVATTPPAPATRAQRRDELRGAFEAIYGPLNGIYAARSEQAREHVAGVMDQDGDLEALYETQDFQRVAGGRRRGALLPATGSTTTAPASTTARAQKELLEAARERVLASSPSAIRRAS